MAPKAFVNTCLASENSTVPRGDDGCQVLPLAPKRSPVLLQTGSTGGVEIWLAHFECNRQKVHSATFHISLTSLALACQSKDVWWDLKKITHLSRLCTSCSPCKSDQGIILEFASPLHMCYVEPCDPRGGLGGIMRESGVMRHLVPFYRS